MRAMKSCFWAKLSSILWLLAATVSLMAQSNDPGKDRIKPPFPEVRLSRQVRGEEAIRGLGSNLPAVAAWYGKTAADLAKLFRQDRTLWASKNGRLVYTCELEAPLAAGAEPAADALRDHIGSFPPDQTFKLHSLAGSQKTLYLNFVGGTISGTAWNAGHNNGADIIAAPFDLDGNPASFNATELQLIQNVWKRVAEDYSPFDVDVTTERPAPEALTRSNSSDTQYGNTVMITPTNFYANAGGVSYVGVFNDIGDYYKPSWAFSNMLANGEKYIAEACSHENGHAVGLQHEGTTGGTVYYQGQGDWAPIMGNSYYKNVTQWAKGEYANANNTEDQLQVMQNYGLAYYADDHGNAADTATQLPAGASISGSGFIERNTDMDVFKFLAGAGPVSLSVTPAPLGPDLKIRAELYDGGGTLLASSSLPNLAAAIGTTIPAGAYYLAITGTGSGDPVATGYSNYASLGQYVVTGTIADPGSVQPPIAVIEANVTSGEAPLDVTFSGADSTDSDGYIASYTWNFGDGSPSETGMNPTHRFTSPGSYKVSLVVTDDKGLTGSSSLTVNATKDIFVNSIELSSSSSYTAVSATAAVTVLDRTGQPVPGATVSASWSGIASGATSAITNLSGVAYLVSPQSSNSGTFTFTLTGVSPPSGCTYNSAINKQNYGSITANLLPDLIPPSVNIISPVNGAKVTGTVSVLVSASDNVGIRKVELYVDERLAATSTVAPFTTKWNASKASRGTHTIRTKAYDAAGNSAASQLVSVKK